MNKLYIGIKGCGKNYLSNLRLVKRICRSYFGFFGFYFMPIQEREKWINYVWKYLVMGLDND